MVVGVGARVSPCLRLFLLLLSVDTRTQWGPFPLLRSFSGSPRPRTGRAVGPNLGTVGYSYAFAALPSPPLLRSLSRACAPLLALSFRRERERGRDGEEERGPRFRINYRSACPVPEREPFRRVTYYIHTCTARFERGRIDFKEAGQREEIGVCV